jgi:hypothetical protein
MKLPNIDILPFPNSVFYLTGLSLITLVYASYSKTINKLPQAISEGITTASSKINEVGKSISTGTKDLYGKTASPTGPVTGPVPPVQERAPTNPTPQTGTLDNINKTISNMNPFAEARPAEAAPRPPIVGGSKKKRKKRNKKTKRSRR